MLKFNSTFCCITIFCITPYKQKFCDSKIKLIIKENEQKKHAEDFINPVKLIAAQIEYRILWQTEMKSH